MVPSRISDREFLAEFERNGARAAAEKWGIDVRSVYARRARIEERYKRRILSPGLKGGTNNTTRAEHHQHPGRINLEVLDGVVLVGGDCHYWPGPPSLMHLAFVQFCRQLRPVVVVLNGDICDFGGISRHPPIGWTTLPEAKDELDAVHERLHEIELAAFKARKIWPLGNHDQRYETYLACHADKVKGIRGTSLKDHFPLWEPCWRVDINRDVVIKHCGKGGKHDAYNSALHAGVTVILGHNHCPFVRTITDVRGDRYAVNHGMIADPDHRAFLDYTEDSPYKDWRAAFCVLTFQEGRLLPPELVTQWDQNSVVFRGRVIMIAPPVASAVAGSGMAAVSIDDSENKSAYERRRWRRSKKRRKTKRRR
jgi:hypothetical protein